MKQSIREVRFNTKAKHPLMKKFSETVTPYAWKLVEGEMKIMKLKTYDFVMNEVSQCKMLFAKRTNYFLF